MTVRTTLAALATLTAAIFSSSATAAPPPCRIVPVGTVYYSAERCSRGPCYQFRVTGNRPDAGIFSVGVYGNGYYQWVYIRQDIYRCR